MSQSVKQYPQTVDDFNRVTSELRAAAGFREPLLFSIGRRVFTRGGTLASVRYPAVNGPGQNLGTGRDFDENSRCPATGRAECYPEPRADL